VAWLEAIMVAVKTGQITFDCTSGQEAQPLILNSDEKGNLMCLEVTEPRQMGAAYMSPLLFL
jgi:hypothetical protein